MKAKALRAFSSTRYGDIAEGQIIKELPESLATLWASRNMVEIIQDPSAAPEPAPDFPTEAGEASAYSSLPADQALPKKTRKKWKEKGESLQ